MAPSDINRFDLLRDHSSGGRMYESCDGGWVKFSEVQPLLDRIAELEKHVQCEHRNKVRISSDPSGYPYYEHCPDCWGKRPE